MDLGLGGFGIEIHDLTGAQVEKIQKLDTYILTIYIGKDLIMADVKNVWNRVIFDQKKMFLKGGVAINILSPEDRLKLSGIIAKDSKQLVRKSIHVFHEYYNFRCPQ